MLSFTLFGLTTTAAIDQQLMDKSCMLCALHQSDPASNAQLTEALTNGAADAPSVCGWRGIGCQDARVTSLVFSSLRYNPWEISLRWLPPTIRFLHLTGVQLFDRLEADRLPRDLRYICLTQCPCRLSESLDFQTFDFRRLPQNMEELILMNSWMAGTLLLDELPSSVRIIQIFSNYVKKVVVGKTVAPPDLNRITICGYIHIKVHADIGSELREVVRTSTKDLDFEDSMYFEKFHNDTRELWNDAKRIKL